jgi:dihydroflavonol-4-reductase
MSGCTGLFHMASPFPGNDPENEDEVIKPALEGTKRVIAAADEAGIKRAVLTSSVAAIAYGTPARPGGVFTEDDWTDTEGGVNTYVKSKTLAERAAWDLANQQGGPALSVVNPSLVLGPLVEDDHGTSVAIIRRLLSGRMDEIPARGLGVVDVRDVALAHIRAFERDAAIGERFITSAEFMTFEGLANLVRADFPDLADRIPTAVEEGEVERRAPSSTKAAKLLDIDFISGRESLAATCRDLIERGLV